MNDVVHTKKEKSSFRMFILIIVIVLLIGGLLALSSYQKKQKIHVNNQEPTELDRQQELLLSRPDVINTNWLHTLNPLVKNVQGRLVWSSKEQLGVTLFTNLPKVAPKQSYHLYLYDLGAKNNNAIRVAIFKPTLSGPYEASFKPNVKINSPLKFELILEEKGVKIGQPLLFAQP